LSKIKYTKTAVTKQTQKASTKTPNQNCNRKLSEANNNTPCKPPAREQSARNLQTTTPPPTEGETKHHNDAIQEWQAFQSKRLQQQTTTNSARVKTKTHRKRAIHIKHQQKRQTRTATENSVKNTYKQRERAR
jgi:hypothetical protein